MVTVGDLLNNVDVQSEYCICYFDEKKYERIEVALSDEILEKCVQFMYAENGVIYIEFDNEEKEE